MTSNCEFPEGGYSIFEGAARLSVRVKTAGKQVFVLRMKTMTRSISSEQMGETQQLIEGENLIG